MFYTTDFSLVSLSSFQAFIENIDKDFIPPLIPRIEVKDYYEKLKSLSDTVFCIEDSKIVGMAATYCNDTVNYMAYTTLVGVDKQYRGKHIATILMQKTIGVARSKKMKKIGIHTNNEIARELYIKVGFSLIGGGYMIDNQINRYYLEYIL